MPIINRTATWQLCDLRSACRRLQDGMEVGSEKVIASKSDTYAEGFLSGLSSPHFVLSSPDIRVVHYIDGPLDGSYFSLISVVHISPPRSAIISIAVGAST